MREDGYEYRLKLNRDKLNIDCLTDLRIIGNGATCYLKNGDALSASGLHIFIKCFPLYMCRAKICSAQPFVVEYTGVLLSKIEYQCRGSFEAKKPEPCFFWSQIIESKFPVEDDIGHVKNFFNDFLPKDVANEIAKYIPGDSRTHTLIVKNGYLCAQFEQKN